MVSHQAILNGTRSATFSIQKKEKALTVEDLSDAMLYKFMKKYVMSQDKLKEYGYPFMDTQKEGCVILPVVDSKTLNDFKSNLRICSRCKKQFQVNDQGAPTTHEACVYHYGRLWNERSMHFNDMSLNRNLN